MEMRVVKNRETMKKREEAKYKSTQQSDCHKLYGKIRICNQFQNVKFITPPINNKEIPFTSEEREKIKLQKDKIDAINDEDKEDDADDDAAEYNDDDEHNYFKDANKCNDIYNEFSEKCEKMAFDTSVLNAFKKNKKKNEHKIKESKIKNNPNNPYGRLAVRRGVKSSIRGSPKRRTPIIQNATSKVATSKVATSKVATSKVATGRSARSRSARSRSARSRSARNASARNASAKSRSATKKQSHTQRKMKTA